MELKEVTKFLEDNKDNEEVKKFVGTLNPLTVQRVKDFLDTHEDGQVLAKSISDQKVSKAIETFKEKTLPGLVEAEKEKIRLELNPKETEDQKEIRLMKDKQGNLERQLKKQTLENIALSKLTEHKLPKEFASLVVDEDEEKTTARLDLLTKGTAAIIQSAIAEQFKAFGRSPKKDAPGGEPFFTIEQIKGMSEGDILANLDKVNESLAIINQR